MTQEEGLQQQPSPIPHQTTKDHPEPSTTTTTLKSCQTNTLITQILNQILETMKNRTQDHPYCQQIGQSIPQMHQFKHPAQNQTNETHIHHQYPLPSMSCHHQL